MSKTFAFEIYLLLQSSVIKLSFSQLMTADLWLKFRLYIRTCVTEIAGPCLIVDFKVTVWITKEMWRMGLLLI